MKEYEEAIKNYKKCLKLFGNNTWTPPIPDILVKIGQNYMCLSKETVALEYYYEALRLCEDHYPLFSGHVVRKYNLISQYYDKVGNSQKQLDFNNSAIEKYTSQLGPKHEAIASFLYNISIAYIKLNKYDEAITSLKKALIIIEDHPNDYPTKDMIIKQMELIDGKNNEGV